MGHAMRSGFHAHDGWYFRRGPDGQVVIEVAESAHEDAPIKAGFTSSADTWASIVAAVSAAGETAATFQAARALHAPEPATPNPKGPTIGEMVQYRGKQGHTALRAAVITATVDTLDPRGVEAGHVPPLDSANHVHLHVFTPGPSGFFVEYNVPLDAPGMCRPGTWQRPTRA